MWAGRKASFFIFSICLFSAPLFVDVTLWPRIRFVFPSHVAQAALPLCLSFLFCHFHYPPATLHKHTHTRAHTVHISCRSLFYVSSLNGWFSLSVKMCAHVCIHTSKATFDTLRCKHTEAQEAKIRKRETNKSKIN